MSNDRAANPHELFAIWALVALLGAAMLAGYWTSDDGTGAGSVHQTRGPRAAAARGGE